MKKDKKMPKKIWSALTLSMTALLVLTLAPPIAEQANAGVASGGGGGGSGGGGGAYWVQIDRARQADLSNGVIYENVPSIWRDSPVCRNNLQTFILVPNAVDRANGPRPGWTMGLFGTGGMDMFNQADSWKPYDAMRANGASDAEARSNLYNRNLICIDDPIVTSAPFTNFRVTSAVQAKNVVNRQATHTYITSVTPEYVLDADKKRATKDIIGKDNLNAQSASKLTDFGKVYEEVEKAKATIDANKAKDMAAEWKSKVTNATDNQRTQVDLNAKNKEGMAEGGILNVTESQKRATINISTTPTKYQVQARTFQRQTRNGAHVAWVNVSAWANATGSMSNPNNVMWCTDFCVSGGQGTERQKYKGTGGALSWYTYSNVATVRLDTTPTTGFWQMLSVHCNDEGFKKLVAELGSKITVETTGGEANGTSGFAHTEKYTSVADAKAKNGGALPFGDASATTPGRKATSTLGFFDKECSFECIADPSTPGATTSNDAVNNVVNTVERNEHGDRVGATLDNGKDVLDGNLFELFRDNQDREIRLNVRYPVSSGNISYDGHAAKTTTVTNWKEGTPKTILDASNSDKAKNNGGIFSIKGKDGKNIFGPGEVKNQRNWDSGAFTSPNAAVVPYHMNKLTTKATWASEVGYPQIVNVKWEYAPQVSTSNIPTGKIGFNNSGAKTIGTKTTETAPIEGKCYAQFGKTDDSSIDTKQLFLDNTGSGTTNKIDTNILGTGGDKNTAKEDQLNLVFNFVRSTTE